MWAMSARMCMQSFVALRCVLTKPQRFLDARELITTTTRTRTTRVAFWDSLFGTRLPGPKKASPKKPL